MSLLRSGEGESIRVSSLPGVTPFSRTLRRGSVMGIIGARYDRGRGRSQSMPHFIDLRYPLPASPPISAKILNNNDLLAKYSKIRT